MAKRKPLEPIRPLPHWAMAVSEIQNQLGIAYVHAALYHAGCMALPHNITDIGVDFTMRYVSAWSGGIAPGKALDIQLKSSYAVTDGGDFIKYHMERAAYDKLRRDADVPQIFVLFAMPRDPATWIETDARAMSIKHCAYWMDMRQCKPKSGSHPLVLVPKSQLFGAPALLGPIWDLVETWKAT